MYKYLKPSKKQFFDMDIDKQKYDIIFLALPRWDSPYASTAFSLAQELAKHHRVFYFDNPFTWKDIFKGWSKPNIQSRKDSLIRGKLGIKLLNDQLYVFCSRAILPINFLPKGLFYNFFERINNKLVANTINRLVSEEKVNKYILINSFNPFYFPLAFIQKPILTIYQSVDNIEKSNYVGKHGTNKEKEIANVADFVITTSSQLTKKLINFSKHVYCIPNAADTQLFNKAQNEIFSKPSEWKIIGNRKVIIYTGNICHRLDYPMLYDIAKIHSDKVLLMVGPSKNNLYEKVGLQNLPNVVFTGSKKPHELPAYLQHSHCGIIPFLCNELTASIYPLKINEYLASGIPVVSTPFSEDILGFKDIIGIAANKVDFSQLIEEAITNNTELQTKERLKYAMQNTWENRTKTLLNYIDHHLQLA
jgi:teichuronic acid biosynthesis glycosyltransferase TuaH